MTESEQSTQQGWWGRLAGEGGSGGLPVSSTSQAYEASRIAKAGAGTLYGLSGYNSGPAQFILVFDSGGVPADTAVPKIVLAVGATSNFALDYTFVGRAFTQGIVVCNSSTGPTKTIGSANCWFDVQYV